MKLIIKHENLNITTNRNFVQSQLCIKSQRLLAQSVQIQFYRRGV